MCTKTYTMCISLYKDTHVYGYMCDVYTTCMMCILHVWCVSIVYCASCRYRDMDHVHTALLYTCKMCIQRPTKCVFHCIKIHTCMDTCVMCILPIRHVWCVYCPIVYCVSRVTNTLYIVYMCIFVTRRTHCHLWHDACTYDTRITQSRHELSIT